MQNKNCHNDYFLAYNLPKYWHSTLVEVNKAGIMRKEEGMLEVGMINMFVLRITRANLIFLREKIKSFFFLF